MYFGHWFTHDLEDRFVSQKEERSLVVVAGEDMSPAIKVGERLEIASVSPDQIRVGDIIVFQRYVLIAHRVLGTLRHRHEYFFFTQGDKCTDIDSPVCHRNILGRVVGKSIRMVFPTRNKIIFASLLIWYLLASPLLYNSVIRRSHKIALHIASLLIE